MSGVELPGQLRVQLRVQPHRKMRVQLPGQLRVELRVELPRKMRVQLPDKLNVSGQLCVDLPRKLRVQIPGQLRALPEGAAEGVALTGTAARAAEGVAG
jgi:hypothetical protein